MTRGVKYHDLETLRAAVLEHARDVVIFDRLRRPRDHDPRIIEAEIGRIAGMFGGVSYWESHRAAVGRCGEAVAALGALEAALADVERFAGAGPAERVRGMVEELRAIARDLPTPRPDEHKRSPRAIFADRIPEGGWWGPDGPGLRDRALLSFLAGNWPRSIDAAKVRRGMTVAEVVRAEQKAIGEAIDRREVGT